MRAHRTRFLTPLPSGGGVLGVANWMWWKDEMEGRNGRLKKARGERKRQGRNGREKEEKEIRKEGLKEEREGFLCPRLGRASLVLPFLLSFSSFLFFLPSSLPSFSLPFLPSLHSLLLSFPPFFIFSSLSSLTGGRGSHSLG